MGFCSPLPRIPAGRPNAATMKVTSARFFRAKRLLSRCVWRSLCLSLLQCVSLLLVSPNPSFVCEAESPILWRLLLRPRARFLFDPLAVDLVRTPFVEVGRRAHTPNLSRGSTSAPLLSIPRRLMKTCEGGVNLVWSSSAGSTLTRSGEDGRQFAPQRALVRQHAFSSSPGREPTQKRATCDRHLPPPA